MIVKNNYSNIITNLLLLSNYILLLSNILTNGISLLVLYIFAVTMLWLILSIFKNNGSVRLILDNNKSLFFLSLFSLISFIAYRHYENDYIKPFFTLFIFSLATISNQNNFKLEIKLKSIRFLYYSTILISTIVYLFPSLQAIDIYEQTRFNSFYKSPTVFAVYINAIFLIYFFNERRYALKLITYFITLFFIYISGTRLNTFLFVILTPIIFSNRITLKSKWVWVISLTVIPLFYPLFLNFQEIINSLLNRRGGESSDEDDSTLFRLLIIWEQIDLIINSSFIQHLIGHGSESCLDIFSEYNYSEAVYSRTRDSKAIWTHFDFTRIYIDFGLFFTSFYFYYLLKTFTKTKLASCMLILYFISFYHNMYNDPLLVVFLILSTFSK